MKQSSRAESNPKMGNAHMYLDTLDGDKVLSVDSDSTAKRTYFFQHPYALPYASAEATMGQGSAMKNWHRRHARSEEPHRYTELLSGSLEACFFCPASTELKSQFGTRIQRR